MKRGEGNTNLPELSLLNLLTYSTITAISWLPPWISHFFYNGLLGGHTLFYSWAVFRLDFLCSAIIITKIIVCRLFALSRRKKI